MQTTIVPSQRDQRIRDYITPVRIVWQNNVDNAQGLLNAGIGQSLLDSDSAAVLKFGSSLIIDFGKELHGGIQLISGSIKDNQKLSIRIRFGESVSETLGSPDNDHAIHDAVLTISGAGWLEFGSTGFRFIRIDMLTPDYELQLMEVRAVSLMRDLEYRGCFECSDERLSRVWQTGAYTTHLCMQDYLWDGIKRDRLVWMGDMHPEMVVSSMVFGRTGVVEKSLDLMRDQTDLPDHMNGIGSYSLWWIIAHRDWYLFHGAYDYLLEQRHYLKGLLRVVLDTMVDCSGMECMPGWRFLDWPTSGDKDAIKAGLQALLIIALEAGGQLCRFLCEEELANECARRVTLMRKISLDPVRNKQVNALKILAMMGNPENINSEILAANPYSGLSTFYGYYVLQARAMAGDYNGCLEMISKYWGGMLDLGATSFWEHFELEWLENASKIDEIPVKGKTDVHKDCGAYCFKGLRHSLCHGWASGPTAWLSEHVLGVKVLKPGATHISVVPHLGNLKWAKGKFPTPKGDIEIEHTRSNNGKIESRVKCPDGVSI